MIYCIRPFFLWSLLFSLWIGSVFGQETSTSTIKTNLDIAIPSNKVIGPLNLRTTLRQTLDSYIHKGKAPELYDPARVYAINDFVFYNGKIWQKQTVSVAGVTPAQGADWDEVSKPGSGGSGGVSSWNDLTDKPTLFSGSYTDLTNKPTLFDGTYSSLTGKPSSFVGDWNTLLNKPTLFNGVYSSLTGVPSTFAPSAHSHTTSEVTGLDGQLSTITGNISTNTSNIASNTTAIALKANKPTYGTLTYSLTPVINLAGATTNETITLTGSATFTTSGLSQGATKVLRLVNSAGTQVSLQWPNTWSFLGNGAPPNIAAGKTAYLVLESWGTTDANVIASYSVTP